MTDTHDTPSETAPRLRACDAYYHANAKGTGSAVKLELHPAHDSTPGSVFVTLAAQLTVGGPQNGAHVFPTFDWKGALKLKLDRTDLSQILQVLRGVQESARDGRGLFHRSATGSALIRFEHQIEPRPGYLLSVRSHDQSRETESVGQHQTCLSGSRNPHDCGGSAADFFRNRFVGVRELSLYGFL